MTVPMVQSNAQNAERSKASRTFMPERTGITVQHAKSVSAGKPGNGQRKTKKENTLQLWRGSLLILKRKRKTGETLTTGVGMASAETLCSLFSKNSPSGVKFAARNCRKTIYASITATLLAMFGASSATSATYGSLPSSDLASWKPLWHTSKGIEARNKQPCDNTACTGYDKIEITPKELLNSAVFNWSRVVSMFSLSGTELLYTRGEEEIIDLMSFYVNAAEKSVKESFETALIGDGTGSGGRQMIGFGGAIPIVANSGTYGGIDRADVPNWRTSSFNATTDFPDIGTTWDSTTARPIIERIALNRSRNNQYPDLWIFDAISYQAVSASFVAHQRLMSDRLGRLGFSGLAYHTPAGLVDLVAAGGVGNVMPANTAFGIDTSSLSIYEFPGQSFVPFHPGDGLRPINQDAVAQGIVWSGQLVLENPLFTLRLQTA